MVITTGCWLVVALVVNAHLYPYLLKYQANAQAGRWAAVQQLVPDRFYGMQVSGTALDFYAGHPVQWLSNMDEVRSVIAPGVVIYTDASHFGDLRAAGLVPRSVIDLENYEVQLLGLEFILPASRVKEIEARYLLRY